MESFPLEIEGAPLNAIDPPEVEESSYLTSGTLVTSPDSAACHGSRVQGPISDANVIRLLDASANRAREALRVIEDYVRFALDDRHLTRQLKTLRHRLTSALAELSLSDRLTMRDTRADVGTTVSTDTEQVRQNAYDVLTANFTRLQEALRSLEEFGKIENSEVSQLVEQIRYDTYTAPQSGPQHD